MPPPRPTPGRSANLPTHWPAATTVPCWCAMARCSGFLSPCRPLMKCTCSRSASPPSTKAWAMASCLLHALHEWARQVAAHTLWLEVRSSNARARSLYEGAGFVAVGQRKDYYPVGPGVREAAVLMCKDLCKTRPEAHHEPGPGCPPPGHAGGHGHHPVGARSRGTSRPPPVPMAQATRSTLKPAPQAAAALPAVAGTAPSLPQSQSPQSQLHQRARARPGQCRPRVVQLPSRPSPHGHPATPVAAVAPAQAAEVWQLAPAVHLYPDASGPASGGPWLILLESTHPTTPLAGAVGDSLDKMLRALGLHQHPQVWAGRAAAPPAACRWRPRWRAAWPRSIGSPCPHSWPTPCERATRAGAAAGAKSGANGA